ncbi:hypothetical protein H8R02_17365 [Ramlibacter sp. GTP1]|uniref:UDP-glucose/GDP-mannose dehydrogenase C-terminal domain-containing protein n=1 Tax=Ramlibacter albus TaxID=2079448 RepID=A0A923MA92_9BURK|nr:hypothetical protein [Ramlibacter albus]
MSMTRGVGSLLRTKALWGRAFKPNTDDMREAASRDLTGALLRAGTRILAHDPVAQEQAARVLAGDFADAPELLRKRGAAARSGKPFV